MKIVFDKVSSSAKPFECTLDGVTLNGTLKKSGYRLVALKAKLNGEIDLDCDRCGKTYPHSLDSDLGLSLSDVVLKDKDDLDIIEFLDGVIDISYILESEINIQKSTYHYCPNCDNDDDDFEIEF